MNGGGGDCNDGDDTLNVNGGALKTGEGFGVDSGGADKFDEVEVDSRRLQTKGRLPSMEIHVGFR